MAQAQTTKKYETIIGLEVHVELGTDTKVFCDSPAHYGGEPNTHICPGCLGLPGALPVPNRKAVEYAIRASLALNCEIASWTRFDRKNYHYPDLPTGYQITQNDFPLGRNGWLDIEVDGETKRIRIRRIHLEQDAGKSLHEGVVGGTGIDLNRAGVPLIEIVTEPDIRSPEEARLFLTKLRNVILYTGVSDVKMEEGSLRCDANISIHPVGSDTWGEIIEIKNMNSFRSVYRALQYEEERQAWLLDNGERIETATRHWNEARGETMPSRSKEEAHDYRFFPEPDVVPMDIDRTWVEEIRNSMPELPDERIARYMNDHGLSSYDANVLVDDRALADFFDAAVAAGADPKAAANWLMSELLGFLNAEGKTLDEVPLTPEALAGMLRLLDEGVISGKIAKEVFEILCREGGDPEKIVKERGLMQISDTSELEAIVQRVLEENPKVVADVRGGKDRAMGFLVGQVMKATRGKANPGLVNELLKKMLS